MKPDWNDAPDWARWLTQDRDGWWRWWDELPRHDYGLGRWWHYAATKKLAYRDEPNKSWTRTVEPRPEQALTAQAEPDWQKAQRAKDEQQTRMATIKYGEPAEQDPYKCTISNAVPLDEPAEAGDVGLHGTPVDESRAHKLLGLARDLAAYMDVAKGVIDPTARIYMWLEDNWPTTPQAQAVAPKIHEFQPTSRGTVSWPASCSICGEYSAHENHFKAVSESDVIAAIVLLERLFESGKPTRMQIRDVLAPLLHPQTDEALRLVKALKLRIAFIGHPGEPRDEEGRPKWSDEIAMIENFLAQQKEGAK